MQFVQYRERVSDTIRTGAQELADVSCRDRLAPVVELVVIRQYFNVWGRGVETGRAPPPPAARAVHALPLGQLHAEYVP